MLLRKKCFLTNSSFITLFVQEKKHFETNKPSNVYRIYSIRRILLMIFYYVVYFLNNIKNISYMHTHLYIYSSMYFMFYSGSSRIVIKLIQNVPYLDSNNVYVHYLTAKTKHKHE